MSEDLIKRTDAIMTVGEWTHSNEWGDDKEPPFKLVDMLAQIPSADRPQGEWEIFTQGWHSMRRCSKCRWTQTYSDPKYMGYEYNYCPNCGARMRSKLQGSHFDSIIIDECAMKGADDE